MPFIGLGLHFAIALFFAVHAVRTRREMYWLLILFSFPILGSIVYYAVVFLPHSKLERGILKVGQSIQKSIDPDRALREAQHAFDLAPTAQNQMALAHAFYDAGKMKEAVSHFDACLSGPFANDPDIGVAAAMARLGNGQVNDAIATLEAVRARAPSFRPEQVGLLLAQAYVQAGQNSRAGAQFEELVGCFGSTEVHGEYYLWAHANGEQAIAQRELKELDLARKHMSAHTRDLYRDLFRRIDDARGK